MQWGYVKKKVTTNAACEQSYEKLSSRVCKVQNNKNKQTFIRSASRPHDPHHVDPETIHFSFAFPDSHFIIALAVLAVVLRRRRCPIFAAKVSSRAEGMRGNNGIVPSKCRWNSGQERRLPSKIRDWRKNSTLLSVRSIMERGMPREGWHLISSSFCCTRESRRQQISSSCLSSNRRRVWRKRQSGRRRRKRSVRVEDGTVREWKRRRWWSHRGSCLLFQPLARFPRRSERECFERQTSGSCCSWIRRSIKPTLLNSWRWWCRHSPAPCSNLAASCSPKSQLHTAAQTNKP